MKLLSYIFVLVCLLFGISFAALNASDVTIHFYWRELVFPLSMVLMISFAIGAMFGILFSLVAIIKAKTEAASYKRKLSQAEKQLDSFRKLE